LQKFSHGYLKIFHVLKAGRKALSQPLAGNLLVEIWLDVQGTEKEVSPIQFTPQAPFDALNTQTAASWAHPRLLPYVIMNHVILLNIVHINRTVNTEWVYQKPNKVLLTDLLVLTHYLPFRCNENL